MTRRIASEEGILAGNRRFANGRMLPVKENFSKDDVWLGFSRQWLRYSGRCSTTSGCGGGVIEKSA